MRTLGDNLSLGVFSHIEGAVLLQDDIEHVMGCVRDAKRK